MKKLVTSKIKEALVKSNHQACADLAFLALTIWREARGESLEAKAGVAYCIMNRVNRPSWWGRDITSVVFKRWQFSSMTDSRDRQLTTWPATDDKSWVDSLMTAFGAMNGTLENPVPGADSYHDISIPPPPWAQKAYFAGQLGRLRFYDVDKDLEA